MHANLTHTHRGLRNVSQVFKSIEEPKEKKHEITTKNVQETDEKKKIIFVWSCLYRNCASTLLLH